jgi:hypothetical protein
MIVVKESKIVNLEICHAGLTQQIFSKYRRLAFSADLLWKIETFAFCTELPCLPTFCKMSADTARF